MLEQPCGIELPRTPSPPGQCPAAEPLNAPLHLFSASPELVEFGQGAYRRRSVETSQLLRLLLEKLGEEGFAVSYTMEDFKRDYVKKHFALLTPQEQREALQAMPLEKQLEVIEALPQEVLDALPPERRLAGLSAEQIRQYLEQLTANRPSAPRNPRRKK
jgi:hypothetical protein